MKMQRPPRTLESGFLQDSLRSFLLLLLGSGFLLTSCEDGKKKEGGEPAGGEPKAGGSAPSDPNAPQVFTTFYPTAYFTERIAGNLVKVVCPVPADADAIFWKPDAAAIQRYQKADLIVLNGAEFAKWVGQVSLPENRVVNTAKPFKSDWVKYELATKHSHGGGKEHSHEGIDGHTWVDPVNAKVQAGEILKALEKKFPKHAEKFQEGFRALASDLDALDAAIKKLSIGDQPLLASHPAYNYLISRYGWNLQNLDLDPEEMPDDATFADIKKQLEQHPAKTLIWEGDPKPEIAQRFQDELGLVSVVFSPCELLDSDEAKAGVDYLSVMQGNVERLQKLFP